MNIDPKTAVAAVEVAGKVAPQTLQQVDKFGADVAKTARLLLAPLQFIAAWQDRNRCAVGTFTYAGYSVCRYNAGAVLG